MKKIFLCLLISLCLVGCGKKETTNKDELTEKEPVIKTELTDDEKKRIAEIDAEIAKHTAIKDDDTSKCRAMGGSSSEYIECINAAYDKLNKAISDISKEKQDIEATIGTVIEEE